MGTALCAALLGASPVEAEVSGGSVVAGNAQISGSGTGNVLVTQASRKAVVDWRSFSVAAGDSVRFAQPDRGSVTLNRVTGATGSRIDGSLTANGQVWLLNPNGVIVGSGGRIAAGGFLATTHALSGDDFMAGRYRFDDAAAAGASVINAGRIEAGEGGYVVLAGREVGNHGLIEARLGTVALGAAKQFTLDLAGDRLLSFAVAGELEAVPASGAAAVTNRGVLRADGGRVVITARAAADVVEQVINTSGLVQAQSVRLINGKIVLDGGEGGLVLAAGKLDVSGQASGETGGRLQVLGDTIIVSDGARLDARGDAGGGEILVGGGWQGERIDGHASAIRVAVSPSAKLDASAITNGDGGMVVAWSDVTDAASRTYALGHFRADGGALGGDGGRIETSGHDLITTGVNGSAAAPNGKAGTWLFDPYDIEIVAGGNAPNIINPGFEDGLTGWTVFGQGGGVIATTSATSSSQSGSQHFTAQEGERFLLATAGTSGSQIGVQQSFTGAPGQSIQLYGLFLAKDYIPFNDFSVIELIGPDQQITTLYSRNVSQVGDYGTAPWQLKSHTLTAGGTYTLRAYVTNVTDSVNSSQLGFEVSALGGSTSSGGAFGAGSGGQLWTATGNSSKIDVNQINSLLTAGTNVHVSTAGPGTQAGDITVSAEIVKGGSTTASLKLEADHSIIVNQGIRSTSGILHVDLEARTGGITVNAPINVWPQATAGDIKLTAATGINLAGTGTLRGHDISLNADDMDIGALVESRNSVTAAPRSAARSIRLGSAGGSAGSLSLGNSELSRLRGPKLTIGHDAGTGAVDILAGFIGFTPSEAGRQIVVRTPGATGRIDIRDQQFIGAGDSWRFVAGDDITLHTGSNIDVAGELELVAGQSFINEAGSNALTSEASGRWLVYSADPSLSTFDGLSSGQTALWGRSFEDAAAGNIETTGNRYAFGLAPTLTISAGNRSKTYGTELIFGPNDFTVGGLVNAAQFGNVFTQDVISGGLSFTSAGAAERANVGTYDISLADGSLGVPSGYSVQLAGGTLTVNPKAIGASLIGTVQKTYDGSTTATLDASNYELSGVLSGDSVGVSTTAGSYDDKNAGTGKTVTVASLELTGASAGNYTIFGKASGEVGRIDPRAITGNATATSKVYDGTTAASGTVEIGGVIAGDSVAAGGATFTFADKNAGTSKLVNVNFGLTGADAGNYLLSLPSTTTADIFQKVLGATAVADDKIYDGTTAAIGRIDLTGVIAGDMVTAAGASFAFADRNAGTAKTVTISGVKLAGADAGNYSITAPQITTASILQKLLSAAIAVDDKVYDGTTAATGTASLVGSVEGDGLAISGGVFTFADKNAGFDKLVNITNLNLTGADAGNYALSVPSTTTADIFRKTLGATALADSKIYDGTTSASGTIALNGVVGGDAVSAGAQFAFADKNAGTAKTVNVSGVTLSGVDAGNYALSAPVTTIADILKKVLAATIAVEDKVYDGTTSAMGTTSLTGTIAGDGVAASGGVFTFADKNAGLDKFVTVANVALTGADAGNYTLSVPSTTTADIVRKTLGATAFADSKVYDGTAAATGRLDLTGAIAGDAVAVDEATFSFADRSAGAAKTVNIAQVTLAGADAANYSLVAPSTAFADIFRKSITATVSAQSKTYDGTTAAIGTVALTGTIAGDVVGPTGANFAFANKNAGTSKTVNVSGVTLTGADAGNYALSAPSTTTADIFRKTLGAAALADAKVYDGTTAATGRIDLTGAILGDAVTVSGATFAFADKNAGVAKAVNIVGAGLTGTDAGNYSLVAPLTTTADITRKSVTATATAQNKIYDGTTVATGSVVLVGTIAGDLVTPTGASFAFADKDVGAAKAVIVGGVMLAGADAGNYTVSATASSRADITPKALSAALIGSVQKVYDATTAAQLTAANYSLAGFVTGEGASVGQTSGSFASANVGSNLTVTASLAGADFTANGGTSLSNYLLPGSAIGAIGSITPATLTYVANPVERPRGNMNPALSGAVSGFVGGETQATATTGTLAFTTTAALESPIGLYAINGGGLAAGNYVFTQAAGNATAFRINEAMSAASNVATVVQSATVAPPPTPAAPPAPAPTPTPTPTGPTSGGTPAAAASVPPPPPPPPPPPLAPPASSGPVAGNAPPPPPPPGPPVEATPPSPVGEQAPPTPSDTADQGDPVLAEAETPEEEQDEAPSEKRQLASTAVVVPGVNVEVPTTPRPPEVPGADQSFSGSGNPAQW